MNASIPCIRATFKRLKRMTKFGLSTLTLAVASAIICSSANASHSFDKETQTHTWNSPELDAVFFPETTELKNNQSAVFKSTSTRWMLSDFGDDFSYTLDKVSFTSAPPNEPDKPAHKFFAVIDGSNTGNYKPLDPNRTYLTINELRLGLNTALQLSGNVTDKTVNFKKIIITNAPEEGHKLNEYDPIKNAVNIQAYQQNYSGPEAKENSFKLNEVIVEENAAVTFSAKGSDDFASASTVTVSDLILKDKAQVISGYAYGWSGIGGLATGKTLFENVNANGDASITVDNGTLTLGALNVDAGKTLKIHSNSESKVNQPAGSVAGIDNEIFVSLAENSALDFNATTIEKTELTVTTKASNPGKVSLGENTTLKGEAISVTGLDSGATGDVNKDLAALAQVVQKDGKGIAGVAVTQEATDIYDGGSALTTANGGLSQVVITPNANIHGIAEMTAVGLHIWRNEINDMNKRLGELRDSSDDANGVWARVYNGKAKFGDQKITNKYTAFQFGYDRQVADGLWLGGALSWTDGESDFAVGGGDNSLMALTAYGSKLWDNGMFVDVTGKFGRIKNEFDISLTNGRSSADYDANAVSVSAEAGWRVYPLNNGFFVEPQIEMMYGRVESVDYTTSTGVKVNQDSAETLIGRAGFVMGLKCPADRGNAYVRASVLHDWEGDANFKFSKDGVNSRAISESLGGTWYEYGIGANFNATKQLHIYADVEAANGGEVDTDYRVNLGMRYSF